MLARFQKFYCWLLIAFAQTGLGADCGSSLVIWGRDRFDFIHRVDQVIVVDRDFGFLEIGTVKLRQGHWKEASLAFKKSYADSFNVRRSDPRSERPQREKMAADFIGRIEPSGVYRLLSPAQGFFWSHDFKTMIVRQATAYWVVDVASGKILDRIWLRFPARTDQDLGRRGAFLYIIDRHMVHFYNRHPGPHSTQR